MTCEHGQLACPICERDAEIAKLHTTLRHCLLAEPPGDCYASEVVELRAEIARLREALESILQHQNIAAGPFGQFSATAFIARAALAKEG